MINKNYKPIFIGVWKKEKNSIVIRSIENSVTLHGMTVKSITKIVDLCNGKTLLKDILFELSLTYHRKELSKLFDILIEKSILVNASDMSTLVTTITKNPLLFTPLKSSTTRTKSVQKVDGLPAYEIEITDKTNHFLNLLNTRSSCRNFSNDSIPVDSLNKILWSGYGIQKYQKNTKKFLRRTVPSAGAKYPIYVSLILFRDSDEIKKGIYDICFTSDARIQFIEKKDLTDSAFLAFSDTSAIQNAFGVVVISANYEISANKYGNKAIRHVLIEAGHVAQNICLMCHEQEIGSYEFAGFCDEVLSYIIQLSEGITPIHTIVFGVPSHDKAPIFQGIETFVSLPRTDSTLNLPFFSVFGRNLAEKGAMWSSGKDYNLNVAAQKMQSEIIEWSSWDFPKKSNRILKFKPVDVNMDTILKPDFYHHFQYREKSFNFEKFNQEKEYRWVLGSSLNENSTDKYILSESIFFSNSLPDDHSRCTTVTSSGCATHITREKAIESALCELIERDAFMITWINQLSHIVILKRSLPVLLQSRIKSIESFGYEVVLKKIDVGIAPVVLVCARSYRDSKIVIGMCFSINIENAINSALSEVEISLLEFLGKDNSILSKIVPSRVETLAHHEQLHNQKRYFYKSDFLFQANKIKGERLSEIQQDINMLNIQKNGIVNFISKLGFCLYVVEGFSSNSIKDIFPEKRETVRVVAPEMVPLSYGYRNEPMKLTRLYTSSIKKDFTPSFSDYRNKNRFPHPFN